MQIPCFLSPRPMLAWWRIPLLHVIELVDICNSLGWGSLLGKELCWWAVVKDCLSIIVLHVFYEWNAPQLCLVAGLASEDGGSHNYDFCIHGIVNVHLNLVEFAV
jgi:hypothetical protein